MSSMALEVNEMMYVLGSETQMPTKTTLGHDSYLPDCTSGLLKLVVGQIDPVVDNIDTKFAAGVGSIL